MASFFAQKYRDLYKVHNVCDSAVRHQAERRSQCLAQQKKQRQETVREARGLVHAIENYSLPNYASNRLPYRVDVFYRNKVQLSEWLRDRPDDLHQWILVPCPRGKRHLVVAAANKTIAYSKTGVVIDIFQSSLQSGRYLTILDCIYSDVTHAFYVLDVLVYHNQEFLLCDAAFRFYWIRSKFDEFDHSVVHEANQYAFHHIDRADFDHPEEVEGMLARCPLWEENKPELDGFLLYHKMASYTHGKTPLVGWLCPWMVPEMLGYAVHPQYLKERSGNAKAVDFMDEFDERRKVGQQQKRNRHFFNANGGKKKGKSGGGASGDSMEVVVAQDSDPSSSWSGGEKRNGKKKKSERKQKMEVEELIDDGEAGGDGGGPCELDDIDLEEDEAEEELQLQRDFAQEMDENEETNSLEGDTVAIELLDKVGGGSSKQRNNINEDQREGGKQRISTVFKF